MTPDFHFPDGEILLVHKPIRWTSFDVVAKIRQSIGTKTLKVGHAGTLDPLADGLLIVCTGKKTKEIDQYQAQSKEYTGIMTFGATRPSIDLETEIDHVFPTAHLTETGVRDRMNTFIGESLQSPPGYSAKRIDGVRAYHQARKGETVLIPPKMVSIGLFELVTYALPHVHFRVECSKGTYIRSMVRDCGVQLHSGAYLSQLTRTAIGDFRLEDAWSLADLCARISAQVEPSCRVDPKRVLAENKQIKMYPANLSPQASED